jgi:hypothetical protein
MVKSHQEFVGATPGDVSGIEGQIDQWLDITIQDLGVLSTPSIPVSQFEVNTVAGGKLATQFPEVYVAGK